MVEVAKTATPSGVSIDWYEASADSMPVGDETFDAVLCQMGLQFMPDRPGALEEMHRVLVDGGRALVSLPGPTPPMFRIFAEAMGEHIQPEASGFVHHVFSLHDTREIESLMRDAGFGNVAVGASSRTLHLPPPKRFLWQYVWGTPLSAIVAAADEEARDALERSVVAGWQEFTEGDTMRFPLRIVIASGTR